MNFSLCGKIKITLKLVISCIDTSCRSLIICDELLELAQKLRMRLPTKGIPDHFALNEIAHNFALGCSSLLEGLQYACLNLK